MSTSTSFVRPSAALRTAITGLLLAAANLANAASTIVVHNTGTGTAGTCNLAQAINAANAASNIAISGYGSSSAQAPGNCQVTVDNFDPDNYEITFDPALPSTIVLDSIDNYWYGPNALPPVAAAIHIIGADAGTTLQAVHVGDPTPATAGAFRFFYVCGGIDGLIHDKVGQAVTGALTLENIALQGGYASGGDSRYGGGGAGMGGAIFNQGVLRLVGVSLIGNVAQGGGYEPLGPDTWYAGGGMGQDAHAGGEGGGFGGVIGGYGGTGGANTGGKGGGGGGGFVSLSNGYASINATGGQGGGLGMTGGPGGSGAGGANTGGIAGDGGGGGGAGSIAGVFTAGGGGGGGFGGGGGAGYGRTSSTMGGGGVGGGGGSYYGGNNMELLGDGGRFGAGGTGSFGTGSPTFSGGGFGGFGGGGGGGGGASLGGGGGFGGGSGGTDPNFGGGGGAGMGGAIFNHRGSLTLLNVTAARNAARGGAGYSGGSHGSGLGAVIFNLNGAVAIEYSTMAANTVSGTNGLGANHGAEDGAVYSVTYANTVEDGSPNNASLSIHASIIRGPKHDSGAGNAVVANRIDGDSPNPSTVSYWFANFIAGSTAAGNATTGGTGTADATDPLLLALTRFGDPELPLPVFPFRADSPALNAATTCRLVDGSGNLVSGNSGKVTFDARGVSRSYAACDVGAYEYDNDEIFPDDFDGSL
jgi:hypothetical protein